MALAAFHRTTLAAAAASATLAAQCPNNTTDNKKYRNNQNKYDNYRLNHFNLELTKLNELKG